MPRISAISSQLTPAFRPKATVSSIWDCAPRKASTCSRKRRRARDRADSSSNEAPSGGRAAERAWNSRPSRVPGRGSTCEGRGAELTRFRSGPSGSSQGCPEPVQPERCPSDGEDDLDGAQRDSELHSALRQRRGQDRKGDPIPITQGPRDGHDPSPGRAADDQGLRGATSRMTAGTARTWVRPGCRGRRHRPRPVETLLPTLDAGQLPVAPSTVPAASWLRRPQT
jgi:hypothetical protein